MPKVRLKKQKGKVDSKLFILALVLTAIGLVAVADASAPQALNYFSDKLFFVKQQAVWALVGIVAMLTASRVHYSFWEKLATPLFFTSVVLLILVLVPGLGTSALGARRWLAFGSFSFQPSEVVKLTMALYLAKVAANGKKPLSYFLPLGLVAGLIMLEPDLGTTLVIGLLGMAQIFVSGINIFYFLGAAAVGGLASFLLIIFSDYRKQRLLTFLEATQDPLGRSYHIRQVLLALGSGGFFGVGLGQSRQKYLFLPEAATDSIFAVIAEEVGFLGAFILIILFAWLIIRALKIAKAAPDTFSKVLGVGIAAWIGGQVFLNIGSMVALVPLTGVPLPFLSYGGTALTMVLLSMGILLNISRYAKTSK